MASLYAASSRAAEIAASLADSPIVSWTGLRSPAFAYELERVRGLDSSTARGGRRHSPFGGGLADWSPKKGCLSRHRVGVWRRGGRPARKDTAPPSRRKRDPDAPLTLWRILIASGLV